MSETIESRGRIEVAPEVLMTIARATALSVPGVIKMAALPAAVTQLFRRATRQDGVSLRIAEGQMILDLYVLMEPTANMLQTSRILQSAVVEAITTMVGVPVEAVNIHVEDVLYAQDEAV